MSQPNSHAPAALALRAGSPVPPVPNTGAPEPPAPGVADPTARRRARAGMLAYEFAWGLAVPFLLISTMHTAYLDSLGIGKVVIGLVPAVFAAGYSLVGPISAALLTGRTAFAVMIGCYLPASAGMAAVGLAGVVHPQMGPDARQTIYWAGLACWTVGLGVGDPHYIAAAVGIAEPGNKGGFFGRRWVWFGLGGAVGSEFSRLLLEALDKPHAYHWGFLIGGSMLFAFTLSFIAVAGGGVEPSGRAGAAGVGVGLRAAWADPRVRRLLGAFCLFTVGQQVFPFLALALTHGTAAGRSPGFTGSLNLAIMLGTAGWALVIGRIADAAGRRAAFVLMAAAFATGLAGAVGLLQAGADLPIGTVFAAAWLCYFAASAWQPGTGIVFNNMIVEATRAVPAAQAVALMGAVLLPLRMFVPPTAGWGIERFDYGPVLLTAAGAALAAIVAVGLVPPATGNEAEMVRDRGPEAGG